MNTNARTFGDEAAHWLNNDKLRSSVRKRMERRMSVTESGCWEWNGAIGSHGYGVIGIGDKATTTTHRVAWMLHHQEPLTAEDWITHDCDNRKCINPMHIRKGTPAQNVREAILRGRITHKHGEEHCRAKLTEVQVREIRSSPLTSAELARKFKVGKTTIACIKNNLSWKGI